MNLRKGKLEKFEILVKEDIVSELSDCDEISIINATSLMKNNFAPLMKNNFGFLKIYVLRIK